MILDHQDGTTVGMKLSGGADSSIIYYAFCEKYKNNDSVNIVVITLDTDLNFYYVANATRIIEKVAELTGKRPLKHFTNRIPHGWREYTAGQEDLEKQAQSEFGDMKFYSGMTTNPNIDDMKEYFLNNEFGLNYTKVLDTIAIRDVERDELHGLNRGYRPFGNSDKRAVSHAYNDLNALDIIYTHTNSCEDVTMVGDDGIPIHCGHCWNCLERWYAFGRIL